jgi:DNA-binding NtrC family response regulator
MRPRIVVCDDEELVRWSLVEGLKQSGFEAFEAIDGQDCLEVVERESPALVLMDVRMPRLDGLQALRRLRESGFDAPVLMLTAMSDIETAVEATQLGAARYLTKPFDLEEVRAVVREVLSRDALKTQGGEIEQGEAGIIGRSLAMQSVFQTLNKLRTVHQPTILLTGESGTGKDVLARAIHHVGSRSDEPFVEVDCTAIPEALLESTLFGHEKGAFTDARNQHRGLFEVAGAGVVFLDEIGELPLAMQAKLLRALENRRFKRVGGSVDISFHAAIIAATNRDLKQEVASGRFREDLFYRLAVVQIALPPLRAREEDVRLLAQHFVEHYNRVFERSVQGIGAGAVERLMAYRWPGNVRELRNVIECAMVFKDGDTLEQGDLPSHVRFASTDSPADCPFILPEEGIELDAVERGLVIQALERTDHNYAAAARLLGLSRYALRNRVKKFGLQQSKDDDDE